MQVCSGSGFVLVFVPSSLASIVTWYDKETNKSCFQSIYELSGNSTLHPDDRLF